MNPERVPAKEFTALVVAQFAGLPEWVREAVQDVAILTEDDPPPGARPEKGLLLGQYRGVPRTRRGHRVSGSLPDTIVLYRRPIVRVCRQAADLPGRVRQVLLHEIGHALGLGEARLRELGVG